MNPHIVYFGNSVNYSTWDGNALSPTLLADLVDVDIDPDWNLSLRADFAGTEPLTFSWFKDRIVMAGEDDSAFQVNSTTPETAGEYFYRIENPLGSVTSDSITVFINGPPLILSFPQSLSLVTGDSAVFEVVAKGIEPLTYQWAKDGDEIGVATGSVLEIANVQVSDAAGYACTIQNVAGAEVVEAALIVDGVLLDADSDTLNDDWELANLGNLLSGADDDPDGDGFTNAQEEERGTDPLTYVLSVKKGWNLVALSRMPTNNSIQGIFGEHVAVAWMWQDGRFVRATELQPLKGYWVYATEQAEIEVQLP